MRNVSAFLLVFVPTVVVPFVGPVSLLLIAPALLMAASAMVWRWRSPAASVLVVQALLALLALSAWLSVATGPLAQVYPARSIEFATRISLPFVFFTLAYFVAGSKEMMIYAIAASAALHGILAIYSLVVGDAPLIGGVYRAEGALTPNILANLISFALLLMVLMRLRLLGPKTGGLVTLVLCGVLVASLIATATLKNFFVTIAIVSWLYIFRSRRAVGVRVALAFLAGLPLLLAVAFSSEISTRLLQLFGAAEIADSFGRPSSLEWRFAHWQALIADWWNNYLLSGAGIGQSLNMQGVRAAYGGGSVAHGDWVAFIVEGGLGLAPLWGAAVVSPGFIVAGKMRDRETRVSVYSISALIWILMAFGNVIYTIPGVYLYWAVLGTLAASARREVMSAQRIKGGG